MVAVSISDDGTTQGRAKKNKQKEKTRKLKWEKRGEKVRENGFKQKRQKMGKKGWKEQEAEEQVWEKPRKRRMIVR